MSKKKPCGLDYCPQEEIVGAYASCMACAWGCYDTKAEAEEIAFEHNRVYGHMTRIVEVQSGKE